MNRGGPSRRWLAPLLLLVGAACSAPAGTGSSPQASALVAGVAADPWATLVANAKKEGTVVLTGGNTSPEMAQALTEGFRAAYGIDAQFATMDAGAFEARADREFKAGAVSIDASFGVSNCFVLADRGEVENMKGVLIEPDAIDPSAWKNGGPRLFSAGPDLPSDFVCGSEFGQQVQPQIYDNPSVIPDGTINTWNDLLNPAFKGKIAGQDPRIGGAGQGTAISINYVFGEDFFKQLYLGQGVVLSREYRQVADWVAHGDYPIGLGTSDDIVFDYREQGLPIQRIFPADGADALTEGGAAIFLLKNAPHPNAAKLFVNWVHTQAVQELWEQYNHTPSLRTDTTRAGVVPWVIPNPDTVYHLNDGDADFYYTHRAPIVDRIQAILGR